MRIYDWLISAFWLILLGYWIVSALNAKKNISRGRSLLGIRILIIIVLVFAIESHTLAQFDAYNTGVSSNLIVDWLGVALCALGVSFAIWARVHLGRNWGMPMSIKEDSELVTSGPYAYVRHPIYSGILLAILGTALTIGLWWLALFVIYGAYFIYSAPQEEKRMLREFPNQYPDYKKRTKMLIPFVL